MTLIGQVIVDGVVIGSTYTLVALGFTLVFGVLKILNVAHADFYTLGSYVSLWVGVYASMGGIIGLFAAVVAGGFAGLLLYAIVLRRLAQRQMLAIFIATLGVSFFLENVAARVFGPNTVPSPPLFPSTYHTVGGLQVSDGQLLLLGATAVVAVGLIRWIGHSNIGRDMRAVAESSELAQTVGVNVPVVMGMTIAVASAIAAFGGVLVTNVTQTVSPFLAAQIAMKMFVVTMVAGPGSVTGALVAGMGLGIAESFTVAFVGSSWRDIVGLVALVIILLFRPQGLFGKKSRAV